MEFLLLEDPSFSRFVRARNLAAYTRTHSACYITRVTNPEPTELRINERSRYCDANRPCLSSTVLFRGTIWRHTWKSITISVRKYATDGVHARMYISFSCAYISHLYIRIYIYMHIPTVSHLFTEMCKQIYMYMVVYAITNLCVCAKILV